jgi:hypothetical protein
VLHFERSVIGRTIVLSALVFVLEACGSRDFSSPELSGVAAVVDGVPIPRTDVDIVQAYLKEQGPSPDEALGYLIDWTLASQAADRRSIAVSEAELQQEVLRFQESRAGSPPNTFQESDLKRVLGRALTAARYWDATVVRLVRISDLDMMEYREDHPGLLPDSLETAPIEEVRWYLEPLLVDRHVEAASAARLHRLRRDARIHLAPGGRYPLPGRGRSATSPSSSENHRQRDEIGMRGEQDDAADDVEPGKRHDERGKGEDAHPEHGG